MKTKSAVLLTGLPNCKRPSRAARLSKACRSWRLPHVSAPAGQLPFWSSGKEAFPPNIGTGLWFIELKVPPPLQHTHAYTLTGEVREQERTPAAVSDLRPLQFRCLPGSHGCAGTVSASRHIGRCAPFPRPGVQANSLTGSERYRDCSLLPCCVPRRAAESRMYKTKYSCPPKLCSFTLNIPASPCRLGPCRSSRRGRVLRAPETLLCSPPAPHFLAVPKGN